jgi:uncharacterized protein (DUF1800 family)
MERRSFITQTLTGKTPVKDPVLDIQNQKLPDNLDLGVASITPYTGSWGKAEARHLLRRALFGFTKADVDFFAAMTMGDAVDYIMNTPVNPPLPPLNGYNTATLLDPNIAAGSTWVNGPDDNNFTGKRRNSLYAWWMQQILNPDRNIREKMTMFWHNHFATEVETVGSPIIAYNHHKLLRENCLGNFKTFVKSVTIDPAMLVYLNGNVNTKTAPDENHARELMELFTLGKGADSQYTEDDVKNAARVLTGWRINNSTYTAFFNSNNHETSNKTFSAFFNNTTITGQTGANGAFETDDLLNMIFSKSDVVARYIVRRLYRYFVYYVIDSNIENNVIIPLANDFKTNWEIKPIVTALLKSQHFFDSNNVGCNIKNPIDVIATCSKNFMIVYPSSPVEDQYQAWYSMFTFGAFAGMTIGNPPSVSGWPAYYQSPQFTESWLNSDTLPKRISITVALMAVGYQYKAGKKLQADVIAFAKQFANPEDPTKLIQDTIDLLLPLDLSSTSKTTLKQSTLLFGQSSDYYWTTAWNDYIASPNDATKKGTVTTGLQLMLKYLLDLAENQLS